MNNKGKSTALVIILILIVALVVAYLAMTQMGNLGFGKKQEGQTQNLINMSDEDLLQQAKDLIDTINTNDQDIVQQAQDIVNQLNQAQQNAVQEP